MRPFLKVIFFTFLSLNAGFFILKGLREYNVIAITFTNDNNIEEISWYYDHLTQEDRKKIRWAMDYSIPRKQVIEGLMQGYAFPLATEVGTNMPGYDPSIQAREFNKTRSLELMADVFGKIYDPELAVDDPDTYTDVPYFSMTLICPTTSIARAQWGALTAKSFEDIGIDVELKWWNWNIIFDKIFTNPAGIGFNDDHGGYDAIFMGYKTCTDPDYSGYYYTESFVPFGNNFQWIERPDIVEIIKRSLTDPDLSNRLEALADYQAWFYEWVPQSIIRQGLDIFPQDPDWIGFDTYNYGRYPWIHNMTFIGEYTPPFTYTSTVPSDFIDFNPLISNNPYDSVVTSNYHLSLSRRRGIYNLSHPVPQVATSWTQSSGGLVWTVDINTNLRFSNGDFLTVEDVKFSYDMAHNCLDSIWTDEMTVWFNSSDDIKIIDEDTIEFTMKNFYPYVESAVFGIPILSKAQMESVGLTNWKTHATNTGTAHLHGLGPYMMDVDYTNGSNGLPSTVKSIKNPYYNGVLIGHDPNMAGGGYWTVNVGPQAYYTIVEEVATTAITGLQTGLYDLLDPKISVFGQIEQLKEVDWCKLITAPEYGWEGLAYNHYDPRWGLNPHDPRIIYTETSNEISTLTTTSFTSSLISGFEILIIIVSISLGISINRLFRKEK